MRPYGLIKLAGFFQLICISRPKERRSLGQAPRRVLQMSLRKVRDLVTVVGNQVTDPVSQSKFSIDSPKGRKILRNAVLADMSGPNPATAYIMGDKVYNPSSGQFVKSSGARGKAIITAATEGVATTSTAATEKTPEPIKGKIAGKPWIIDVNDLLSEVEPFRIVDEFGVSADPRTAAGRELIRRAIRRHEKQVQDAGGKPHLYIRGVEVFNPVTGRFTHREKRSSENPQMLVRMAWDDPSLQPTFSGGRKPGAILARERKPEPISVPEEFRPLGQSKIWEASQGGLRVKPLFLELSAERLMKEREKGKTSAELIESAAEDIGAGVFTGRGQIRRRGQIAEFAEPEGESLEATAEEGTVLTRSGIFSDEQINTARAGMMKAIKDINEARGTDDLRMVITTEFETPEMLDEVAEVMGAKMAEERTIVSEGAKGRVVSAMVEATRRTLGRRDVAELDPEEQRTFIQREAVIIMEEEIAGLIERANAAGEPIDMAQLDAMRLAIAQATDTIFGTNINVSAATVNSVATVWFGISPQLVEIAREGGKYSGAALRVLKAGNKVAEFINMPGAPLAVLTIAGAVAVMRYLFVASGDIVEEAGTEEQKDEFVKQLRKSQIAESPTRGGRTNQPAIEAAYIAHANAEIIRAEKESTYDVRSNRRTAVTRPLISDERVMLPTC